VTPGKVIFPNQGVMYREERIRSPSLGKMKKSMEFLNLVDDLYLLQETKYESK
jgi:hypothetical protein